MIPLLLNCLESQEVVVYTYAAVALDRILSMRIGGSPTLMYALSLRLPPPLPTTLSSSLQVLIRGRAAVRVPAFECPPFQDRDTAQPGAHCGERLSHALCVCRLFFFSFSIPVPEGGVPKVLRELLSRRSKHSPENTSGFWRGSSTSSAMSHKTRATRTLISTFSRAYPVSYC